MKRYIIFAFIFIFFIPLAFVLIHAIHGVIENPSILNYFVTSQFFSKLYNSIILGLGVSILSIILAIGFSFSFFTLVHKWQRQVVFLFLFMLFCISPIIYLIVLNKLAFFNGLTAYMQSLFVLSIKFFPLATIIFIFSYSRIGADSIKIALLRASLVNVFKYIIIPQLYRPLVGTFLIIFVLIFIHEEVPSFLGYRTYAEEFLSRMVVMENIQDIGFLIIPFLLMALLVMGILVMITQNSYNNKSSLYIFSKFHLVGKFSIVVLGILVFFLTFLLVKELSLIDIRPLFMDNIGSLKNSFYLSIITGCLGTIISVGVYSYFEYHYSKFTRIILTLPMFLYWLIPTSISSLGLIELSMRIDQNSLAVGYIFLVFAYLIKVLPIGFILLTALDEIYSVDIFLKLHTIKQTYILRHISIPLQWSKWLMLTTVLTVFSLNELTSTILLIPPGEETIIVTMYNLMHYGDFSSVAFLSLLQMSLVLVSISLFGLSLRRRYDYT